MDVNFWDDRTHDQLENACMGCLDFKNGECISNGGCFSGSAFPTQDDCENCYFYNNQLKQCQRVGGCRYDV